MEISSNINITYLDVNSRFNQVINAPKKFGFTNVTNACLNSVSICDDDNEYLFWDQIHPTTAAHKLFVELAFSAIKPASKLAVFDSELIPLSAIVLSVGAGLMLKRKKLNQRFLRASNTWKR